MELSRVTISWSFPADCNSQRRRVPVEERISQIGIAAGSPRGVLAGDRLLLLQFIGEFVAESPAS